MLLAGSNDEQPFRNYATNDVPVRGKFTDKFASVVVDSNERVVREMSLFSCINDKHFAKMLTLTVPQ